MIGESVYKIEVANEYDISVTFNVDHLSQHLDDEELRIIPLEKGEIDMEAGGIDGVRQGWTDSKHKISSVCNLLIRAVKKKALIWVIVSLDRIFLICLI